MQAKSTMFIDPLQLNARLAERAMPQFRLAALLNVSPAKLSDLKAGRVETDEAVALRVRIEEVLRLKPGALLPQQLGNAAGGDMEQSTG